MLSSASVVVLLLYFPCLVDLQVLPELQCERKRNTITTQEDTQLYLQLERALVVDNNETLEGLRAAFVRDMVEEVVFELDILVVDSPHYNCDDNDFSFCSITLYNALELCYGSLNFSYFAPSVATLSSENIFVLWLTLVHGNLLSFIHSYQFIPSFPERGTEVALITFVLDELQCNPTHAMLACNIDSLFSWVSLFCIKNDMHGIFYLS